MPPGHALYPADLTRAADRGVRRRASGQEGRDLRPVHDRARGSGDRPGRPRRITTSSSRSSTAPRRALRKAAALSRRSGVRQVPAAARRRAAHRRLLRERHRLARSAEPEVRRHLRAVRDLSRRPARREDVLRRGGPDPQRSREPEARDVPEVGARHPGRAAARGRRSAVGARPRHADGSDGRAVPRRRPAPRLPGGRRQPAERPAHPSGEGHEEDLLQELHGRARQRGHPAARRARHGSGAGEARVGRRLPGRRR